VRVADFGLSRECWSTQQMSRLGTVQYAAPEVLLGKPYSHKCDVWSYGVVCWELLTALVPFVRQPVSVPAPLGLRAASTCLEGCSPTVRGSRRASAGRPVV
jgi:serine/threonine protein kinase